MRGRRAPAWRHRRQLISIAAAVAALASTGVGAAQSAAGGGGTGVPDPPRVGDVSCIEKCAGIRTAAAGSLIELTGNHLDAVERVSFPSPGGDRVGVEPRSAKAHRVVARVPDGAKSGKPRVRDVYGRMDTAPNELKIVDPDQIPEGGDFRLRSAEASPRSAFFDGRAEPTLTYMFAGGGPTDLRVEVVNRDTGALVAAATQRNRKPFARNTFSWDGRTSSGQPAGGDFRFRVKALTGGRAETKKNARFSLHGFKFPVRARHQYGDGFGAGRNHQGQDVFARCGSPIVAARGGKVTFKDSHKAAGYYVVISGRSTNRDFMYAHLQRPASVREGERVRTGEPIGRVGATGNAQGCHLHFELWAGAWQQGGRPLAAVTRALRLWDGWS